MKYILRDPCQIPSLTETVTGYLFILVAEVRRRRHLLVGMIIFADDDDEAMIPVMMP
ncbi:hypothetical protein Hdeb2414_s0960g00968521 [Helianthus debilis subsp. tardiflorus]